MFEIDAAQVPFEVDDLDGELLLDLIADSAGQRLRTERRDLRLAYRLCVTHPAEGDDPASWGDGIPGLEDYTDTLGGEGTPQVAAFTVEQWALAAGVSMWSAKRTLAAALDLHHRLPRTWAEVEALRLPGWKARRIAEDTNRLSLKAAGWVDEELTRLGTYGLPTIERTIKSAIAKFHPELVKADGLPGREDWDVSVDHRAGADGTSRLDAVGDSVDLEKFHAMISDEAATMGRLGDTDTLGQRKAKALGALADRQATADLLGLLDTEHAQGPGSGSGAPGNGSGGLVHPVTGRPVTRRRSYLKARLFVHLSLADLAVLAGSVGHGSAVHGSAAPVADAAGEERAAGASGPGAGSLAASGLVAETNLFGPVHLDTLKTWLQALGADARLTPVIDTGKQWAVDRHDPPESMREQVIVRDPQCVFPGCTLDSRHCDLDHIEPFDEDGPPGQTRPDGLAPLCRRHHLAKTHGAWRYVRNGDGSYTWTHHGQTWLVTRWGTTSLTDP